MNQKTTNWNRWDRLQLRTLHASQIDKFLEYDEQLIFPNLSSTTKHFIHRLSLLIWIGELDLASQLWEKEKLRFNWFPDNFEDFLFRLLIVENNNPGPVYPYPEFHKVKYLLLGKNDAYKLSTKPLSELLKMEKPHFSSADGFIVVDFNKRELERLAEMVPEEHHEKLRLPFILLRELPLREYLFQIAGTRLENFYLKRLLKMSNTRIKNDNLKDNRGLNEISMLSRRRFKTIYKILPESCIIWLNTQYHRP